jgi:hypothetical protein
MAHDGLDLLLLLITAANLGNAEQFLRYCAHDRLQRVLDYRAGIEARICQHAHAHVGAYPAILSTAAGACPARAIAAGLPRRAWQRYPAGQGAKGHRYHDRAFLAIDPGRTGHRYLLIRRSRRTGELAFCRCCPPRPVPLPALAKIAGIRWSTEENSQAGKGLTGLDEHQVRRWDSWYRRTTLAMLALAFLTITAATEHASPPPDDQIPLTRNEIAALFSTVIIEPARGTRHRLRWPAWRRRQHRARTCHYQRQARQL